MRLDKVQQKNPRRFSCTSLPHFSFPIHPRRNGTKFYRCKFTPRMIQHDILTQRKPTRRSSMPSHLTWVLSKVSHTGIGPRKSDRKKSRIQASQLQKRNRPRSNRLGRSFRRLTIHSCRRQARPKGRRWLLRQGTAPSLLDPLDHKPCPIHSIWSSRFTNQGPTANAVLGPSTP